MKSCTSKESPAVYEAGTNQGVAACFSRSYPAISEKVTRGLCIDLDDLFFITINPPPDLKVDEGVILQEITLNEQYEYCVKQLNHHINTFKAIFEDVVCVPEKTEAGLIHFHFVARKRRHIITTDISRFIWTVFNIRLGDLKEHRRKAIVQYMVCIEPVVSEKIVEYLFHKDKKDYETLIYMKKPNYKTNNLNDVESFRFPILLL